MRRMAFCQLGLRPQRGRYVARGAVARLRCVLGVLHRLETGREGDAMARLCERSAVWPAARVLWHDASSGQLVIWNVTGTTVTGSQAASMTCGGSCAQSWFATVTADFNNDGNSDILWYNQSTGQLPSGSSTPRATSRARSSCSDLLGLWVGLATRRRGGQQRRRERGHSLAQHDHRPAERVAARRARQRDRYQTLSLTCGAASGCSTSWKAMGFTNY